MATTAESIHDAFGWLANLVRASLKRWLLVGAGVGLFVLAIWATSGDEFDSCGDATAEQQVLLASFREPSADRSFQTASEPVCWEGAMAAPATGPTIRSDGPIEDVVEQLRAEGWEVAANLWPDQYDLHVTCFRSNDERWETIEFSVSASRSGIVAGAEVRATSGHRACEPYSCRLGCDRLRSVGSTRVPEVVAINPATGPLRGLV